MSAAQQLEQKFPGLLDAVARVEDRSGNPNAVSPKGAIGPYQLMPATAAHYGVDPRNPAQAREAAAQNIQEGLAWSKGDLDGAMRYYQGGPNTAKWGPQNAAYPGQVLAALSSGHAAPHAAPQSAPQGSADPYEQALSQAAGHPAPSQPATSSVPASNANPADPYEAALEAATGSAHDSAVGPALQEATRGDPIQHPGGNLAVGQNVAGRNGAVPGGGGQSGTGGVGAGGATLQSGQGGQGLPGASGYPAQSEDAVTNVGEGVHDALVGALRGFGSMAGTGATLVGKGLDFTGLTQGAGDNALKNSDDLQSLLKSREYDPNGWGNMAGEVASALPLAEVKALQVAPEATALARALKYGLQGSVIGGAMSGGHDMLANAAIGAPLGVVGGAVGEKLIAPAVSKAQLLAKAIREAAGGGADAAGAEADAAYGARMAQGDAAAGPPETLAQYRVRVAQKEAAMDADTAAQQQANPSAPLEVNVVGGGAPQAHPDVNSYVEAYMRGEGRGTSPADLEMQQFAANNGPEIEAEFQRRAAGGQTTNLGNPADSNAAELAARLKNYGAGRGIESVREMPQSVADDVAAARAKGIPLEHAQREADVRYVGAEPTIGSTTRDPTAQRLEKVTANLDTPDGQALATRAADNNAAVHNTVQTTIEGYGGVPAQGEVTQTVAKSLANASDAEYGKVSALYRQGDDEAAALKGSSDAETAQRQAAADAQVAAKAQAAARQELNAAQAAYKAAKLEPGADLEKASNDLVFARDGLRQAMTDPPKAPPVPSRTGAGYIDVSPLRDALDAPEMKNPTTEGLGTLANGTRGYIDALSNGTNRVSASEAESIRQAINNAYDIRGGAINSHVGRLKGILDQTMDAAKDAPASYREGRAAYKAWAAKYEDPEGVANIIRRDAKGNFLNEDNWRRADNGLIGTTNEQGFQQITRRLLANRDVSTLDRLKAEMVHRPYEAASKGAGDQNNHAVFSPSKWKDTINSIGMNKYRALFGKDEVAHLATIYRAAQNLHEPVPGVVNSSNSATTALNNGAALAKALAGINNPVPSTSAKAKVLAARVLAHGAALPLHATGAGVLAHVGVEGASKAASGMAQKGAVSAAQKELAAAVRRTLDPDAARAAANENAKRAISDRQRKDLVAALGRRGATGGTAAVTGKGNR